MIRFKLIDDTIESPKLQTPGSVGYDIAAHSIVKVIDDGKIIVVNTGVACQPPDGYFFQLHERSSLHKLGWALCNSVGVIDTDYTGWVMAALIQVRDKPTPVETLVNKRERICQLVLHRAYTDFSVEFVEDLDVTYRGDGGFGSTSN